MLSFQQVIRHAKKDKSLVYIGGWGAGENNP